MHFFGQNCLGFLEAEVNENMQLRTEYCGKKRSSLFLIYLTLTLIAIWDDLLTYAGGRRL